MTTAEILSNTLQSTTTPPYYDGVHEEYTRRAVRASLVKLGCKLNIADRLAKLNKGCTRVRLAAAVTEYNEMEQTA